MKGVHACPAARVTFGQKHFNRGVDRQGERIKKFIFLMRQDLNKSTNVI